MGTAGFEPATTSPPDKYHTKLDDVPSSHRHQNEIIKSSYYQIENMKICSICHKISGTGEDHIDCVQKRRIEMDDEDLKNRLPEKLDLSKRYSRFGC